MCRVWWAMSRPLRAAAAADGNGSFLSTGACNQVRIQVQKHAVYSAAYCTVHHKEPLRSLVIKVEHSHLYFLLSRYCHDCVESDVKQKYKKVKKQFKSTEKK